MEPIKANNAKKAIDKIISPALFIVKANIAALTACTLV